MIQSFQLRTYEDWHTNIGKSQEGTSPLQIQVLDSDLVFYMQYIKGKVLRLTHTKKLVWLKVSSACARLLFMMPVSLRMSRMMPSVRPVRDAAMPSPMYLELQPKRHLITFYFKITIKASTAPWQLWSGAFDFADLLLLKLLSHGLSTSLWQYEESHAPHVLLGRQMSALMLRCFMIAKEKITVNLTGHHPESSSSSESMWSGCNYQYSAMARGEFSHTHTERAQEADASREMNFFNMFWSLALPVWDLVPKWHPQNHREHHHPCTRTTIMLSNMNMLVVSGAPKCMICMALLGLCGASTVIAQHIQETETWKFFALCQKYNVTLQHSKPWHSTRSLEDLTHGVLS